MVSILERFQGRGVGVIGHRGCEGDFPENTLGAFAEALSKGADALELDVRRSVDGQWVVFHDETLQRLTERTERVDALAAAELTMMRLRAGDSGGSWEGMLEEEADRRWGSEVEQSGSYGSGRLLTEMGIELGSKGRCIPLLETVGKTFPDVPLSVEIKETSFEAGQALGEFLLQYRCFDGRVIVGGFSDRALAGVRSVAPGIPTGAGRWEALRAVLSAYLGFAGFGTGRWQVLQLPYKRYGFVVAGRRVLRWARRRGTPVQVWTVNDRSVMKKLVGLGVDGLVTDRTELAVEVVGFKQFGEDGGRSLVAIGLRFGLRALWAAWMCPHPGKLPGDATRQERGEYGEALARHFLAVDRGMRIVRTNWRVPKGGRGEIDVICQDGKVLVFVEVRARAADAKVGGYWSVGKAKRAVLLQACKFYLRSLRRRPAHFRFDIVEIDLPPVGPAGTGQVRHFSNVRLFPKNFVS